MTIKECIDNVDNIKPNQYGTREKVLWLSFLDETIINDVLKTHEGYDGRYDDFTGYTEDKLTVTLIVPSPYDRLYTAYLKMKIDSENGETARYNNSAALFNTYMMEYRKYYNKTHLPLDVTSKRNNKPPKKATVGLSDEEFENLKRELYYLLSNDVNKATSPDKMYDIVMNYVNNNVEMLKGKDGRDGVDGKDGYTPRKNIDYFDGEKGKAFAYDDFTPAQLIALKGEKGDKGDKGERGLQGIQGIKGDKGEQGIQGKTGVGIVNSSVNANGHLYIYYTDGTRKDAGPVVGNDGVGINSVYVASDGKLIVTYTNGITRSAGFVVGEKGDPFTYEDFTEEQLASLKGEDGADGKDAVTDQTYNPKSENAQSGKAVAEALEGFAGGGNGSAENWEVISDTTTEFDTPVSQIVINQDANGNSFSLKKMKVFIDFTVAEAYTGVARARTSDGTGFMYIISQTLSADTVYGYMIDSEVLPMVNNRCSMISHFNDNRMIEGGNNFDFTYNGGSLDYGIRNQKITVTTLHPNVTGISSFDFLLSADGKINKARVLILGVKE